MVSYIFLCLYDKKNDSFMIHNGTPVSDNFQCCKILFFSLTTFPKQIETSLVLPGWLQTWHGSFLKWDLACYLFGSTAGPTSGDLSLLRPVFIIRPFWGWFDLHFWDQCDALGIGNLMKYIHIYIICHKHYLDKHELS